MHHPARSVPAAVGPGPPSRFRQVAAGPYRGRVATHPGRYFIHNDHARYRRARGQAVFDWWRDLGYTVYSGSHHVRLRTPARVMIAACGDLWWATMMERLRDTPQCVTVVDVVGPQWRPDALAGDAESVAYWMQKQHRDNAQRGIAAADAVVTPHTQWDGYPTWLDDLSEINAAVHVLPDLDPAAGLPDIARFAGQLELAWDEAAVVKAGRAAIRATRRPGSTHPQG